MCGVARLHVRTVKDVTQVTFEDSRLLEALQIDELANTLYELVDVDQRKRLLLDFSHVTTLSSSMLGTLLSLKKRVDDIGGRLVLCGLCRDVRRVFELTALHQVFQFASTSDEGLTTFGVAGNV